METPRRRDAQRVEVEREIVILQAAAPHEISPKISEKAVIKNISSGGICVVSDECIKKGTVIEADVMLRTSGMEKFRAYIKAVWSKESCGRGCFETGMEFLGIKETDLIILRRYIHRNLNPA